jgi:hypothetical protein
MTSDRRSISGDLPDGVIPPTEGHAPNPNPEDEVARNRARFEEAQRRLQQGRAEAVETINRVRDQAEHEYEDAQHDPEHQRFVEEQIAHQRTDRPAIRGGKEYAGDEEQFASMPANVELGYPEPKPTTPRRAEEFNNEE